MTFEEWAENYGLDMEHREIDCLAAWDAATRAEREACANVCEEVANEVSPREKWTADAAAWEAESIGIFDGASDCAHRIRERSNEQSSGAAKPSRWSTVLGNGG